MKLYFTLPLLYIFVNLHHKIAVVGHILVFFIQFIHFTFRVVGDKIKIQKSDFEKSTIGRIHRTINRFGVALLYLYFTDLHSLLVSNIKSVFELWYCEWLLPRILVLIVLLSDKVFLPECLCLWGHVLFLWCYLQSNVIPVCGTWVLQGAAAAVSIIAS